MKRNIFILRNLYIFLFIVIIATIVFTPWLIGRGVSIIDEETLEVITIGMLFVVSYIIYVLYKNEIERNQAELINLKEHRLTLEERLDEAFKHIGQVNVQIQEIRSIFEEFKKYPESENDFKNILIYFAERILGMINTDWVSFRIVNLADFKTLKEYNCCRGESKLLKTKIQNSDLADQVDLPNYTILSSSQENLRVKAYCILPKKEINEEAEILVKAIISQLEMIFLIYSSVFLKNNDGVNKQQS